MKPIKIVIEGINSFTDAQILDFEAVGRTNLFCISGKTGAGKTTIFDSIMLALFGNCGRGNLADIINLSLKKARVVLTFVEGGDEYIVDRSFARKASDPNVASCSACILTKNGAPFASNRSDTDKVIREIVGLDEKEFKNVYLLEQGEYADFLKKPPKDQMEAVGKIFSLMRFDDVCKRAKERKKQEDAEADAHGKLIEAYGSVTADSVREEKTALATLKSQTTALKKKEEAGRAELAELTKKRDLYNEVRTKQENVKSLMLQADAKKAEHENAVKALDEFEAARDKTLEDRLKATRDREVELNALAARDKDCAAAEADVKKKRAELEQHKSSVATAEKRAEQLTVQLCADEQAFASVIELFGSRVGGVNVKSAALENISNTVNVAADIVALAAAERDLKDERDKYVELTKRVDGKTAELNNITDDCGKRLKLIERYVAEQAALTEARTQAEKLKDDAAHALEVAKLNSHAQAVRAELHVGDKCPVCGGVYDGGEHGGDTDVAKRKAEFDAQTAAFKSACDKLAECEKTLDREKVNYTNADQRRKECERERAELAAQVENMHVDAAAHAELINILQNAQAAAKKLAATKIDCEKQTAECNLVRERFTAAEKAAVEAEQKAAEYKAELGDYYGKTAGMLEKIKDELAALEKAVAEVESKRKELSIAVGSTKAAAETVEQSLAKARADCPVDLPAFDEEAYASRTAQNEQLLSQIATNDVEIARREVEVTVHEQNLDKLNKANAERDIHLQKSKLYGEIIELTKGREMLKFVAAEYIDDFTAVASDILSELSGGKYTMGYDKENGFFVSDYLNDGKIRKTDTLSGGELFLASLSVAIAIARTQAGGNNAFFFLDEGFGTLDDELIDTVYAALESLSRDCLVGVISHSGELIEKMPSCVEVLEASDATGSIIKY